MIEVVVNGEKTQLEKPYLLSSLIDQFKFQMIGSALALNGEVIPKSKVKEVILKNQDTIEIVQAVGGG